MTKEYLKLWALILGLALMLVSGTVYAQTPQEIAINDCVMSSGVFPAGTSLVGLASDGDSISVDLSAAAVPADFGDTQSDSYTEALFAAVSAWPEINSISITVGGVPISQFLPPSTLPDFPYTGGGGIGTQSIGEGGIGILAAQNPLLPPTVPPLSSQLAGKLIVLHPSHGSYWYNTGGYWLRAMRTLCGPQPTGWPSSYQPSNYYYYTKGYSWPRYYEDDMSPETIRFLYAYCQAAGAATFVSRNLDKTAGDFPAVAYGYPNPLSPLPRWQVATKYNLQELGLPASVWNEPSLPAQSDKDIRARAYYTNYLMQTLGITYQNTVSFSLHSNAANVSTSPTNLCANVGGVTQAQARGTESYDSKAYTTWTTEQTRSNVLASNECTAIINAIRAEYDGFWANSQYNLPNPPPEWCTGYGTYRGYDHAAAATPSTTAGWQNRGPKSGNYGEIREAKCPATLVELLFHDDWKFYPDEAFHQDQIFRATVAWGMYEGFCTFFSVTPRTRLNASVDSTTFPTDFVAPGAAINGTVVMKNLGQAWCWGTKMVGTLLTPYTVWDLQGTAADQFGKSGTKIVLANDGIYYPGDTASFNVALTAPSSSGTYTTAWRMLKDDQRGGSFGSTATAQIQVDADAPVIDITAPVADSCNGKNVAVAFSVTDALSGIDTQSADIDGNPVNSGDSVALATGSHTLNVSATDKVGNSASKSVSFTVDATAPVITIGSPSAQQYALGCIVVGFSATDEGCSGLAGVTANIDGTPVANGETVCWLAIGSHTLTVNAGDNAGNASSQQVTFTVVNSVGKVSVGGWIELADKKGTCGFICDYIEGAGAPTGNLTFQDHDTGMTVKAGAYDGLGISGNHAWLYGSCTIDGAAGHWFRVDVVDNGEPGSNDLFNITLDTGYTKGGNLGGGNVTIH